MWLYDFLQDYALSLILVAVIVRVILLPFQMKGKRGMMRQSRLQPKLAELQKKHGANKQKLNEETAKLYKDEGVNPASGCLWSFIQMPIMIALFYVIRQPLTIMMRVAEDLLSETGAITLKLNELGFVPNLGEFYVQIDQAKFITENFSEFAGMSENLRQISFDLGPLNLAAIPDWQFFWNPETVWSGMLWLPGLLLFFLPVLSGGAQFISAGIMRKMSPTGTPEAAGGAAGNIMKLMPLMSVVFGFMFPAALSIYWTIGTVLQIGQDIWLTKKYTKILDEEDAEKAKIQKVKDAEIEAKRIETERKKAEGLAERDLNTSKRKKKKSKKQGKREKAVDWEKKNAPEQEETFDPSRVGNRRYARGRAYDPDRFTSSHKEDKSKELDEEDSEEAAVEIDDAVTEETPAVDAALELDNETDDGDNLVDTDDDDDSDFEDEDVSDDDFDNGNDLDDDTDDDDDSDFEDEDVNDDDFDEDEDDEFEDEDDDDEDLDDDLDDDEDDDDFDDDDIEDDESEEKSSERFNTTRFD